MKNKKFLTMVAMIMSLVMAVSCGDATTKPDDEKKDPPAKKEKLDISFVAKDITGVNTVISITSAASAPKFETKEITPNTKLKVQGSDAIATKIKTNPANDGIKVEIVDIQGKAANSVTSGTEDLSDNKFNITDFEIDTSSIDPATTGISVKAKASLNSSLAGDTWNMASKIGALEITFKFTDMSGKKEPVELKALVKLVGAA